jgi:hypothetical protein
VKIYNLQSEGGVRVSITMRRGIGSASFSIVCLFGLASAATTAPTQPAESAKPAFDKNSPFYFDGAVSRKTLEDYLDRAIRYPGLTTIPYRPKQLKSW